MSKHKFKWTIWPEFFSRRSIQQWQIFNCTGIELNTEKTEILRIGDKHIEKEYLQIY